MPGYGITGAAMQFQMVNAIPIQWKGIILNYAIT
jgi:hypothetical protein